MGAATAGVGILVGGIIFNIAGSSLAGKVDEARRQMLNAEKQINQICTYLGKLKTLATRYRGCLAGVYGVYKNHMDMFARIVYDEGRTDWYEYTASEQLSLENLALTVGILYGMCKTNLVIESKGESNINQVNTDEAQRQVDTANAFLRERGLSNEGF